MTRDTFRFVTAVLVLVIALFFVGRHFLAQDPNTLDVQKIQAIRTGLSGDEQNIKFLCAILGSAANTAAEARGTKDAADIQQLSDDLSKMEGPAQVGAAFQEAVRFGFYSDLPPSQVFLKVVEACLAPQE